MLAGSSHSIVKLKPDPEPDPQFRVKLGDPVQVTKPLSGAPGAPILLAHAGEVRLVTGHPVTLIVQACPATEIALLAKKKIRNARRINCLTILFEGGKKGFMKTVLGGVYRKIIAISH